MYVYSYLMSIEILSNILCSYGNIAMAKALIDAGATAEIAVPPQIAVPEANRYACFLSTPSFYTLPPVAAHPWLAVPPPSP